MRPAPLAAVSVLMVAGCSTPASSPVPPAAAPGAPVVVTLGDSVPAGTACDCTPFPDLYAKLVSPAALSVSEARPGYTSGDVRTQLADDGVRTALDNATVVLIMAGANDLADDFDGGRDDDVYQQSADGVEENVSATVTAIRQDHPAPVTVVVLGYWNVVKGGDVGLATYGPAGAAAAAVATRYANDALQRAASESGARYVSTAAAFGADPTALLADDGDHPNAKGHQAIAATLYAAVPPESKP